MLPFKIRTTFTLWADPQPSGFFTLNSENFVKIPAGTVGLWIDSDRDEMGRTFDILRFDGFLHARVRPGTFEILDKTVLEVPHGK